MDTDKSSSKPVILVVDDSPDNIHALSGILETEYIVKAAINGQKALQIAATNKPPDLILLDIMMPGMDGYEVCHRLKENESTKDVPVLFLSAVTEVNERVKAFTVGGVDFIQKPFVAEELLARVFTHITLSRLQKKLEKQLEERIVAHKKTLEEVRRHRSQLAHITRLNSMSELAASLAHELNQPLTAIVTNAQTAQNYLDLDNQSLNETREALKDISSDGLRAAEIIKRTRSLMKKGEITSQLIDIPKTIRAVVNLLKDDEVSNQIPIRIQIADDLPLFFGDQIQLEQVLFNIMLNGLEAMEDIQEDKAELQIAAQCTNSNTIEITVQDTGTGLDEQALELIFNPFFTTKPDGLGMGLVICKSIIQAHAGHLWATQNPGPGSTFHITLPLDQEAD